MPESFSGSLSAGSSLVTLSQTGGGRTLLDVSSSSVGELIAGGSAGVLAELQKEFSESGEFQPEWDIQLGRAQLGLSTSVVQAGQGPSFQTGNYAEALALAQGMKRSNIARGLYYNPNDPAAVALEREGVPWYAGYDESTRAQSLQGGQETFLTPAGAGAVSIGGSKLDPSGKDISQQRTQATREANLAPLSQETQIVGGPVPETVGGLINALFGAGEKPQETASPAAFYSGQENIAWHKKTYGHGISPFAGGDIKYQGPLWRTLGGGELQTPGTRRLARTAAQSLGDEKRLRRRLAEEEEARTGTRAGIGPSLQPTALGG